ncbi:MAG TPA: aminodeoxychorismate/anthranilate synthase component II [Candidatus Fusicatenibacter merdavium]|uniref:Aminodeoxychorismate/anthranilate synthase component II n=1 Tax=Candidatus Fusicatenibacter merdavium TaxID=2838600 RepID=A0A9D1XCA1_9FIRM|nr:aminodeoxychorismate/anthranilate synthase component II [Candidatus Fusicatenibacter merdavium]
MREIEKRNGTKKLVLIDNYDSFSYNLYQMLGALGAELTVLRNDAKTPGEIEMMHPDGIILSPGPGRPEDAGCCVAVVRTLGEKLPILGVCLGHQAICTAYGGVVTYAGRMMHGKASMAEVNTDTPLFRGMKKEIQVARYHSLAAQEEMMPECLEITAKTAEGEIMAVQHREYPVFGVQFHPESILTPGGSRILNNFLEVIDHD